MRVHKTFQVFSMIIFPNCFFLEFFSTQFLAKFTNYVIKTLLFNESIMFNISKCLINLKDEFKVFKDFTPYTSVQMVIKKLVSRYNVTNNVLIKSYMLL